MDFLLLALALFFIGGTVSLFAGLGKYTSAIGSISAILASLCGLWNVVQFFLRPSHALQLTLCPLPLGEVALRLDSLSALFLAPILLLIGICALYGMKNGDGSSGRGHVYTGAHWFAYHLLSGGMILALISDNAFLFLLAWEAMSIAPFFIITLRDDAPATRAASWTYLVAAHLGALCLLAFFALLAAETGGSFSFTLFVIDGYLPGFGGSWKYGLLFFLALVGFGAKFGLMPLHVWLPEAHPAAPSHVSALMSGAMVNLGIYGLIRSLQFLGPGEAWWAYTLIGLGAFSAFTGILRSMTQPSIKQALAFSTVENMGIISMGIGIALLCLQNRHPEAATLAATGILLHMVNHSLSKGLLFLCAGSVLHSTGSLTLTALGGLQKRLPVIGWCFVLGSAAISALPPLNGFAGEFYLYLGMVFGGTSFASSNAPELGLVFWLCLAILAATGGFTLLSFTRLYGISFLGEPRSDAAKKVHAPTRKEQASIVILAILCLLSAFASPYIAVLCHTAINPLIQHDIHTVAVPYPPGPFDMTSLPRLSQVFTPPSLETTVSPYNSAIAFLWEINTVFLLLIILCVALIYLRRRILRRRSMVPNCTWSCGYLAPTARMQYSAGSFSRSGGYIMRTFVRQKAALPQMEDYFPAKTKARLNSPDWIATKGFNPFFSSVGRIADLCKCMQHGRLNGYILYILLTLVALLAWEQLQP